MFAAMVLSLNAAELDPFTDPARHDPRGSAHILRFLCWATRQPTLASTRPRFAFVAFDLRGLRTGCPATEQRSHRHSSRCSSPTQALTLAFALVLIVPSTTSRPSLRLADPVLCHRWETSLSRGLALLISLSEEFCGLQSSKRLSRLGSAFFSCLIAIYAIGRPHSAPVRPRVQVRALCISI